MPTGWEPLRPLKMRALPCCKVLDKLLKGSLALPPGPPPPPSKYKLPVEFLLSVMKNVKITHTSEYLLQLCNIRNLILGKLYLPLLPLKASDDLNELVLSRFKLKSRRRKLPLAPLPGL